jgi:hypothetical protein
MGCNSFNLFILLDDCIDAGGRAQKVGALDDAWSVIVQFPSFSKGEVNTYHGAIAEEIKIK